LDVYREVARDPLAADLRRAAERLVVALPRPRSPEERRAPPGEAARYVARHLARFAPERSAFALVGELPPRASLRPAPRDADLAREDLKRALDGMTSGPAARQAYGQGAALGLYLSCSGRGRGLFRHAGLETAYVAQALEPAPVGGMFGAFQFGPVAGSTELLTYAGVAALLGYDADPRVGRRAARRSLRCRAKFISRGGLHRGASLGSAACAGPRPSSPRSATYRPTPRR